MRHVADGAVATDYLNASKKGGKRRFKDAVVAEIERVKREREIEQNFANLVEKSDGFASCSCGWTYSLGTVLDAVHAAENHSIMHGIRGQGTVIEPLDKLGEEVLSRTASL